MATYRQRFTGVGRFGIGLFVAGPAIAVAGGLLEIGADPTVGRPPVVGLVLIVLGLVLAWVALPFLLVGREFRRVGE